MIIYNVTIKVDLSISEEWLKWMKEVHIGDVMNTGLFTGFRIARLLEMDESDGITYSMQYNCNSMQDYLDYQNDHAAELQKDHTKRFKGKFVAFRSLMKEV